LTQPALIAVRTAVFAAEHSIQAAAESAAAPSKTTQSTKMIQMNFGVRGQLT
jgi:hypothetical protein